MLPTDTDPIDHYVTEVLRAAGLGTLPDAAKADIAARLRHHAERQIGLVAVEHLDGPGAAAFGDLMSKQPPDTAAIHRLLAERIPDFEAKVRAGLDELAATFVAAVQPA